MTRVALNVQRRFETQSLPGYKVSLREELPIHPGSHFITYAPLKLRRAATLRKNN